MKRDHLVYVAQSQEYVRLLEILTAPRAGGALILGGHGIGKTTLVRAALADENVPPPAMRVHCSPTLAKEPCGALSPYLRASTPTDSPAHVLREITSVLDDRRDPHTIPIVVVEDAEFLDDETAFVLSTLVENARIKLVAIGHGRPDGESVLFSLAETGLIAVLVVQRLGQAGVKYLAEQLTGAPLTAATVDVIATMTGGNPSFVEAFVESCSRQGLLVTNRFSDGDRKLVALARLVPEPDETLIELVRDVMRSLPPKHQKILELLALGGPRTARELSAFAGGEYRRLIESGVLASGPGGKIRIVSQIHAIVLRNIVPPGRSTQLYAEWSKQIDSDSTPAPIEVLWALEAGVDVPAEQVVVAIEQANYEHDFPLAWRLADAEEAEDSELATLLRARTLLGLGRHRLARTMLLRLVETTADPVLLHRGRILLAIVRDKIDDPDVEYEPVSAFPTVGDSEQGYLTGPRSYAEAERILTDANHSADHRIMALLALTDFHSVAGRTVTAVDYAKRALGYLSNDDRLISDYELAVQFRIGWNLVLSGSYVEAEELLGRAMDVPLSIAIGRAGTLAIVRALGELVRGRSDRARNTLDEAVAELRLHGMPRFLKLALALRAAAETGNDARTGRQRAWVDVAVSLAARPSWILAEAGRSAAARGSLDGFLLIERELLVGPGSPLHDPKIGTEARHRLAKLTEIMEGNRAALLERLAHAFLTSDPDSAEALANDAMDTGEWAIASQSLARAATLWAEFGDDRRCGGALRHLRELIRTNEITPDDYVTRALALAELTRREEEIVDLTRSGKTNAEIARVLTVSQRTVEGHLYRIFSKLGITERSHLNTLTDGDSSR